ncbi:hypothetical protein [Curtobacterium sp. MCSS17_016]|uniref:hypothetical protein n=1 Tax=Curtobacterium sp. MCSS17_016 TaxID=2175644 RepID=UPI000DA8EB4B|nr:hypothetical protein [Curtobacterium sp. MCSS17_016]WIE81310.1 hypothetical protein DEJ19_018930 [Curtobacterium sp. MCSS17_016]
MGNWKWTGFVVAFVIAAAGVAVVLGMTAPESGPSDEADDPVTACIERAIAKLDGVTDDTLYANTVARVTQTCNDRLGD